jgi:pyrimidine operon attenuation protein/uracil phosphoribosyltransferase
MMNESTRSLMDGAAVARSIKRLSHEIHEHQPDPAQLVVVGIVRRGAVLATRLQRMLAELAGGEVGRGTLDISLYRDDHREVGAGPRLLARELPAIEGKHVVLVDDVLYTGRTVRAALQALTDAGRPARIELAVLIDRGERELPIRADYVGKNVSAPREQRVYVRLAEIDGSDGVLLGAAPDQVRPAG